METFTRGHTFQVQNLDRSQELVILLEGAKVELETSLMDFIFVKI